MGAKQKKQIARLKREVTRARKAEKIAGNKMKLAIVQCNSARSALSSFARKAGMKVSVRQDHQDKAIAFQIAIPELSARDMFDSEEMRDATIDMVAFEIHGCIADWFTQKKSF